MVFKKLIYSDFILSFIILIGTPFLFSNKTNQINVLLIISFCYHFINFIFNNICIYYYLSKNKMSPELKKKFEDRLPVINIVIKQVILTFLHVFILVFQGFKLLSQINLKLRWIGFLNFTIIMIHFYSIFIFLFFIFILQIKKFTKTSELPLNVNQTSNNNVLSNQVSFSPTAPAMPKFLKSNTVEILSKCQHCHLRPPNILLNCGHTFCAHCLQKINNCFTCELPITDKKRIEYQ